MASWWLSSMRSLPPEGSGTPVDRQPDSRILSSSWDTTRALRPTSSCLFFWLSISSMTAMGMTTSLSSKAKRAPGL